MMHKFLIGGVVAAVGLFAVSVGAMASAGHAQGVAVPTHMADVAKNATASAGSAAGKDKAVQGEMKVAWCKLWACR